MGIRFSLVPVLCVLCCSLAYAEQEDVVAPGAQLQLVSEQFQFTEGPAVDAAGNVYFTDQPNNRIYLWRTDNSVQLFMEGAGRANGLYVDDQQRLLVCADENNQLWRLDANGKKEILLKDYQGQRFNGPNDVWVSTVGNIYFTDPFYLRNYWQHTEQPMAQQGVYLLSADGQLLVVDPTLVKPNGIVGEGDRLYVADIGADKTYRYRIQEDGTLTDKQLVVELGSDGMTLDQRGNLYLTGDGVKVFNPAGQLIEHIKVDRGWTANVTFAGADRKTLFITASEAVYTLKMSVAGAR